MTLSRLLLSRSVKRVDDLHGFWNLHGSAALEEEEMKAPMRRLETRLEMCVGVSKENGPPEIAPQGQATRL